MIRGAERAIHVDLARGGDLDTAQHQPAETDGDRHPAARPDMLAERQPRQGRRARKNWNDQVFRL
jgi:hypothetical protein